MTAAGGYAVDSNKWQSSIRSLFPSLFLFLSLSLALARRDAPGGILGGFISRPAGPEETERLDRPETERAAVLLRASVRREEEEEEEFSPFCYFGLSHARVPNARGALHVCGPSARSRAPPPCTSAVARVGPAAPFFTDPRRLGHATLSSSSSSFARPLPIPTSHFLASNSEILWSDSRPAEFDAAYPVTGTERKRWGEKEREGGREGEEEPALSLSFSWSCARTRRFSREMRRARADRELFRISR